MIVNRFVELLDDGRVRLFTVSRDEHGVPSVTSEVLDSPEDAEGDVEPWVVDSAVRGH